MKTTAPKSKKKKVTVFNKISSGFRELHVDGAYGGVTPRGLFNMNFFAERMAIPKATDFEIENNQLRKIADSEDSKNGIIREFEMGVYMTIHTARDIHKWLGEALDTFDKSQKEGK